MTTNAQTRQATPFTALVRLAVQRITTAGSDSDEPSFGLGITLALLAAPGGFASILLFEKYSSLARWMRGQQQFDPFSAALPDEYFFIVLAMAITAGVAVWKWESIFPDRRDYINVAHLPLSAEKFLLANLAAVAGLGAALALDANAASSVLFPFVVAAVQPRFMVFVEFAAVHALTVVLASLFAFIAIFAIVGVLLALLPQTVFRRISIYVRLTLVGAIIALLGSSFAVPAMLIARHGGSLDALRWLPPIWFLGLCQQLRSRADAALVSAAHFSLWSLLIVTAIALAAYTLFYRRVFQRLGETMDLPPPSAGHALRALFALLERLWLRLPSERAAVRFALTTLVRSERHALMFGGFQAFGIMVAAQSVFSAINHPLRRLYPPPLPQPDLLAPPLILVYCLLTGLQVVAAIPAELRANWTFRLLLDPSTTGIVRAMRELMFLFAAPVLVAAFILYTWFYGWQLAAIHTVIVAIWTWLLSELLLARFRKMPFTCASPAFAQNAVVRVLFYVTGFYVFSFMLAAVEYSMLRDPVRVAPFMVLVAGILYFIARTRREETASASEQVIFEDAPTHFEFLDLSGRA